MRYYLFALFLIISGPSELVNAQNISVFPFFVNGFGPQNWSDGNIYSDGWWTEVWLTNSGLSAAHFDVEVYGSDGHRADSAQVFWSLPATVGPRASEVLKFKNDLTTAATPLQTGWIRIISSEKLLIREVINRMAGGGRMLPPSYYWKDRVIALPAVGSARLSLFLEATTNAGLALVVPGDGNGMVQATLTLFDKQGETRAQRTIFLTPNVPLSGMVNDLLGLAEGEAISEGSLVVELSAAAQSVYGSLISTALGSFLSVHPEALP